MGNMDTGRQAAIHSFGAVVMMFSQWLISVLLVRMDGYEAAGIFSLALSIASIFFAIASYNFRSFRITDIKGEYTQSQYFTASLLTILLSIAVCTIYALTAKGYTNTERAAIVIYLLFFDCTCASDTIFSYLQVKGHLEVNGYSYIIRGVCFFAGFMIGFFLGHGILAAMSFMAVSNLGVLLFYDLPWYKRVAGETISFDFRNIKKVFQIIKRCFPLMVAATVPIIVTAIPRRSIQNMLGTESLGYFSSIFTITVLISTVAPSVVNAFLPRIAVIWSEGNKKKMLSSVALCYLGILAFMAISSIGVSVVGRLALKIIFGESILSFFPLLYWSIVVSGLYSMTIIGNGILATMRKEKITFFAIIVDFAVAAAASNTAVSMFDIYGGAYVLIAAHLLQTVIQLGFIIKYILKAKFFGWN